MKAKRNRTAICQVTNEHGVSLLEPNEIAKCIRQYFIKYISTDNSGVLKFDNLDSLEFKETVSYTQGEILVADIKEEEMKGLFTNMDSNSCSALDGINAFFYKHSWTILEADIIAARGVLTNRQNRTKPHKFYLVWFSFWKNLQLQFGLRF